MAFDFLKPVGQRVLAHCELLPPQALGQVIYKHTEQDGLPAVERLLDEMLERRTPDGRFLAFATFIRQPEPEWSTLATVDIWYTSTKIHSRLKLNMLTRMLMSLMPKLSMPTTAAMTMGGMESIKTKIRAL